jgi:hypothetical protein
MVVAIGVPEAILHQTVNHFAVPVPVLALLALLAYTSFTSFTSLY